MADPLTKTSPSQILVSMAALVVIIAGMRASADIIVPFLLALFIAIICSPVLDWLERRGLPRAAAMVTVLLAIIIVGTGITGLVGSSLSKFTSNLPEYTERLNGYTQTVETWLNGHGVAFDTGEMHKLIDAGRVMRLAADVFNGFARSIQATDRR